MNDIDKILGPREDPHFKDSKVEERSPTLQVLEPGVDGLESPQQVKDRISALNCLSEALCLENDPLGNFAKRYLKEVVAVILRRSFSLTIKLTRPAVLFKLRVK
jgi:hypothetical protein